MNLRTNPAQSILQGIDLADRMIETAASTVTTMASVGGADAVSVAGKSWKALRSRLLDWDRICRRTDVVELANLRNSLEQLIEAFDSARAAVGQKVPRISKLVADAKTAVLQCQKAVAELRRNWAAIARKYKSCVECGISLGSSETGIVCRSCRVKPGTIGELMNKSPQQLRSLPADGSWGKLQHLCLELFGARRFTRATRDRLLLWLASTFSESSEQLEAICIEEAVRRLETELGGESKEIALSERQYQILMALSEMKALSPDRRAATNELAKRAEGPSSPGENLKKAIADLVAKGYTGSKTGRGGGVWLTEKGAELAIQLTRQN